LAIESVLQYNKLSPVITGGDVALESHDHVGELND
jgi:hypothetical protein